MVPKSLSSPADAVRAALNAADLTVSDAARRLGVSRQQLTRLLGGKSALSADMALRLQAAFDLPARPLLDKQLDRDLAMAARRQARLPHAAKAATQRDTVLRRLRRAQESLRAAGVDALFLFGSVARSEAGAASDVDLWFEPAGDASFGLIELGQMKSRLEKLLGCNVDLAPRDSLRPAVLARAKRDQVQVF